jgi:hypothetical protein
MARRSLLARIDSRWSALCVWFVRRSPLPPDQSIRLLIRLSAIFKLPRPVPVRR